MKFLNLKILLFISVFALPSIADAQLFRGSNYWRQYRNELSFGVGASNSLTELGGRDRVGSDFIYDLEPTLTKYSLSFSYRYYIKKNIAVRTGLFYAQVSGDDRLTNDIYRRDRNLNFKSPIVELSVVGEYHLIGEVAGSRYKIKGAKGKKSFSVGMYLFTGVGAFYFDPRTISGTRLKPLRTEGQGLSDGPKEYSSVNVAIPVGMGFRYAINTQWRLSLQGGYRFTTTDYLDDVSGTYYNESDLTSAYGQASAEAANPALNPSTFQYPGAQRGDPNDRDGYMFAQLQLNYKLVKKNKYGRGKKIKRRRSMPSF
tara:strand:+ start:140 stop:1081 length:942 start_codon:yes stop_codon:yes gene_type:complete